MKKKFFACKFGNTGKKILKNGFASGLFVMAAVCTTAFCPKNNLTFVANMFPKHSCTYLKAGEKFLLCTSSVNYPLVVLLFKKNPYIFNLLILFPLFSEENQN